MANFRVGNFSIGSNGIRIGGIGSARFGGQNGGPRDIDVDPRQGVDAVLTQESNEELRNRGNNNNTMTRDEVGDLLEAVRTDRSARVSVEDLGNNTIRIHNGTQYTPPIQVEPDALRMLRDANLPQWQGNGQSAAPGNGPQAPAGKSAPGVSPEIIAQRDALTNIALLLEEVRDAAPADRAAAADRAIAAVTKFVGNDDRVTLQAGFRLDLGNGSTINLPAGTTSANGLGTEIASQLRLDAQDLEATREAASRLRASKPELFPAPTTAAPAGVAPDTAKPVTAAPAGVAPDTAKPVTAAPATAAPAASAIPPAEGPAAKRYNSPVMPQGLTQSQVDDVQKLIVDAGLTAGGPNGGVDEKWGRASQASFERICKDAGIDPKAVNFADPKDPELLKFTAAAQDRGKGRAQASQLFAASMDKVMKEIEPQAAIERGETVIKDDPAKTAVAEKQQTSAQAKQAEQKTADAAPGTVEAARSAILSELDNGVGKNEARVAETFLATIKQDGQSLSNGDGKLSTQEKDAFRSAIGSSINLADLQELSKALKDAGVADSQQVAVHGAPNAPAKVVAAGQEQGALLG